MDRGVYDIIAYRRLEISKKEIATLLMVWLGLRLLRNYPARGYYTTGRGGYR